MLRPPPIVGGESDVVAPVSAFDNSRELASLVEKSLLRTNEILDLPLPPDGDDGELNARSRVILAATRTVFQTQLRADSNVLKRRSMTAHTAMLRDLKKLKELREGGPIVDAAE